MGVGNEPKRDIQHDIQKLTFLKTSIALTMAGQGSGGNVIAALCSFFIHGLGQLVQGRLWMAIVHFVLAAILWFFFLGWIIHLWSILDAARWSPR